MSHQRILQVGIAVVLVILFLVGCGGSAPTAVSEAPTATSAPKQTAATPTPVPPTSAPEQPTDTPIPPTATPVPLAPTPEPPTATPPPTGPKAGHWEGSEPSISFDVTTDGSIHSFKATVSMGGGECTLDLGDTVIEDNTFVFTNEIAPDQINEMVLEVTKVTAGEPEIIKTDSGEMIVTQRINGKFDDTDTATGIIKIWLCEGSTSEGERVLADSGASEGITWSAEWKEP